MKTTTKRAKTCAELATKLQKKFRGSHSNVFLKIDASKKLAKFLNNTCEKVIFR